MVEEHEKIILTDLRGKYDVSMEVGFSNDEEIVKIGIDGKEAIVPIKDLYNFIFLIASAEQQEKLMPVKQTTVRKIIKRHIVKVTKDIKKGDTLRVRCETNVPVEIWEGLAGLMGKKKKVYNGIPIIGQK